jgi:hypothetical protein
MSHLGVFSKPAATATAVKAASAIRREIRARLTFGSSCCRLEGSELFQLMPKIST